MDGAGLTVNPKEFVSIPFALRYRGPLVAPAGTEVETLVALQLLAVARVPLNEMVLFPCVAPRLAPVIVTGAPTAPESGETLSRLGGPTIAGMPIADTSGLAPQVTAAPGKESVLNAV